jgi:hypothetical protein
VTRRLLSLGADATAPAARKNPRRLLTLGADATASVSGPRRNPAPSRPRPEPGIQLGWIS